MNDLLNRISQCSVKKPNYKGYLALLRNVFDRNHVLIERYDCPGLFDFRIYLTG